MGEVEKIGERIKTIRVLMKEIQEDFAEHCDISPEAISMIERGKYLPRLKTLQKLSDYTKLSVASLFAEYLYIVEVETKINEDREIYNCYGIKVCEKIK